MDAAEFERTKQYVGFDQRSIAALAAFHPVAAPELSRIVDDFYATIEANPETARVITGGAAQIARLKQTLIGWLDGVLCGPHDQRFLETHSRIGTVHVRIGLPQRYMFTAMNRIRVQLCEVAQRSLSGDRARLDETRTAIDQILDLELAIMLDSYRLSLAERIRTAERLATIGQLAASVGHELRNPLGIIESSLFLLRQRLDKLEIADPQLEKHHDKILRQVKLCGQTITNLLDLARDKAPNRRRALLAPQIEAAVENAALPPTLRVELAVPDTLSIDADPEDFGHVVMNLLSNAAHAQKGHGTVAIRAERDNGGTALYVHDQGPGVARDIRHRIFDALFTTKARGTGLGLALCQRIVSAHGGELSLLEADQGALFRVWIPDIELGRAAERGA